MSGGDGMDSVLECPLLGVHGLLWLCPIMPCIKCHCFLRTRLQGR
jgi:hypothetical protein